MIAPLFLNGLDVVSAKITTPGTGTWTADLELDLGPVGVVPSGKAVLTVGSTALSGTIDPRASGKFGAKATVKLVGGGGGWDKPVPPLHLHNDFGVMSTAIFSVTASEVGEVAVDLLPKRLGVDFVRTEGPASRVLAGFAWHVDPFGVTVVGPRVPIPFDPTSVEILEWDPGSKKATLATGDLVVPGTILLDPRFGTATIRDVEQTFGPEGARATAWCDTGTTPSTKAPDTAGGKLAQALGAMAKEASGAAYLRPYQYRVVVQDADKRCTLQAVDIASPAPAILQQIEVWPGVACSSSMFVPGTEVMVAFLNGEASKPVIVGFAKSAPPPLETKIEAARIALGSVAADPVAKAPATQAQIADLTAAVGVIAAWIAAVTALAATPPTSTTFTLFGTAMAGPGATVAGSLAGLSAAVSALVVPATSPVTFTD